MDKIKKFGVGLYFTYDIIPEGSEYRAVIVGLNKMQAIGETAYLAKEELRYLVKGYIQSAINEGIALPKFIEVR